MRLLAAILILFSVVSCSKNKSVSKKVGGEYYMVKLLKDDGSEYTKKIHYQFDNAATDGKTYVNWSSFNPDDSTETTGTYCIVDKGLFMVLKINTPNGIFTDSAKIEDIDKKSMVIRTKQGLNYFKKIMPD